MEKNKDELSDICISHEEFELIIQYLERGFYYINEADKRIRTIRIKHAANIGGAENEN